VKYTLGELVVTFIPLPDGRVVNFYGVVIKIDGLKDSRYNYRLRLSDGGRITVPEEDLRKLTELEEILYG